MNLAILDARRDTSGGYKVDVSRGERIGRVSSEWFSRPADERYLSLSELARSVRDRAERSRTRVVESGDPGRGEPQRPGAAGAGAAGRGRARRADALELRPARQPGRRAGRLSAPASRAARRHQPAIRPDLPPRRADQDAGDRGRPRRNCAPSPARTTAASTTTNWSRRCSASPATAPATRAGRCRACSTGRPAIYNPRVDITKDTTTLYASDRDVFLFLVDDLNPIEAGRLPDGSPDLYFRGFYCWNSEVGAKTLGMASFYLRAVCQNRNLWGVEDFEEITIRHSKYAAIRFAHEAAPALTQLRQFLAAALRQRHQGGARADRGAQRRGPHRLPAQARLLQGRDRRRSSTRCWPRKAARPRASSISCRASPPSRATSRIRTPGSTWRPRPRSCSTGRPDVREPELRSSVLRLCASALSVTASVALALFRGRGRRFAS